MCVQVTTCEQLQAYLSKFVAPDTASAAPATAATVDIPEGFKAMKKKGVEDEMDGMVSLACLGSKQHMQHLMSEQPATGCISRLV